MSDSIDSDEFVSHASVRRRGRAMRRRIAASAATLVVLVSLADHAGYFGFAGNDWDNWNGQTAAAANVVDGDTFLIRSGHLQSSRVHLLGIDAPDLPDGHGAAAALNYVTHRTADRTLTIRLDGTQTRDADGALRAYVYITPADSLNADMVRDGLAYADRRERHTFASAFETSERDARSHHRGLWNGLRDSDQPAWRQAWLKAYLARRKP